MTKPVSVKILNIVYKIIGIFLPVKKRVVFLGSPRSEKLMENTQLVYDALNCEKMKIIRLLPHGIKDIIYISYYIMTSKVIVLDDSYRYFAYIPLKNSQKLVQIWHGPGAFKKMGVDVPTSAPYEKYTHSQYDALVTSSKEVCKYFEKGFCLKSNVTKALGYPRTDLLLNNQNQLKKEFYQKLPQMKDKTVILYMPTFRRYGGLDIEDFDYKINWEELNKYLKENNSIFIVKRHPLQINQGINFVPSNYDNIIDLQESNYFSLLIGADIFITDFSSSFFDYLLLNKPIIFYCPDSHEYLSNHGVYIDFPNDIPGKYCETFDELITTLKNIDKNIDYTDYKEYYMGSCDGNSTKKVVKLIMEYLN